MALFIGLTGGIGSGKSAAAALFERFGAAIISADEIAKEIMNSDPDVRNRLREYFGESVFFANGNIDSSQLAEVVFGSKNSKALDVLNSIVHPPTLDAMLLRAEKFDDEGFDIIIAEIALLYEIGLDDGFDYVIAVDAPKDVRLYRTIQRNPTVPVNHISAIMETQISSEEVRRRADFVIENKGDREELEKAVSFLMGIIPHLPSKFDKNAELTSAQNTDNSQ